MRDPSDDHASAEITPDCRSNLRISVVSSNISNADTAGYTEKTANQSSSVTAGVGTGVSVTGITSAVDKLLLKSLIGANSDLGSADTMQVDARAPGPQDGDVVDQQTGEVAGRV